MTPETMTARRTRPTDAFTWTPPKGKVLSVITPAHPKQREVFQDKVRFKLLVCGRRWGKSVLGQEEAIDVAWRKDRSKSWIIGPTRELVKDIYWDALKLRVKQLNWRVSINETELRIRREKNGAIIQLRSSDNPDALRGRGLDLAVIDEAADQDEEVWDEVIRPALADRLGRSVLIGTPKGRNWLYDLWLDSVQKENWKRWQYKTIDSPFIAPEEVAQAKIDLDERSFRQEWEATFETYEGVAYPYFDRSVHQKAQLHRLELPVCICCDFNLDPAVWLIAQDIPLNGVRGFLSFQGQLKQHTTDVWKMCAALKEQLKKLRGPDADKLQTIFYGDLQHGKQRSLSATRSSWEIIAQEFTGWRTEFRVRSNPRIVDRRNAVNSRLRSASGLVRLGVDPKVEDLIKDFERVTAAEEEGATDQGERTHAVAAAGYFINYEYPVRPNPVGRQL
jgi:Terminase large subunit, T4likevirus-type, N-terminal